jgi:hypothetical protein
MNFMPVIFFILKANHIQGRLQLFGNPVRLLKIGSNRIKNAKKKNVIDLNYK